MGTLLVFIFFGGIIVALLIGVACAVIEWLGMRNDLSAWLRKKLFGNDKK